MGIDHDRCRSSSGRYRLLLWLLLAGLGLVGFQVAHAATWRDGGGWNAAPVSQGNDGVWSVLPDARSPNNSHISTCTASACTRTGDLPAPIGKGNPRLSPSATFPKMNIAAGALALGSRALPWLTAGKALYDWYQLADVTVNDQGQTGEITGDSLGSSDYAWNWTNNNGRFYSPQTACAAAKAQISTDLAKINITPTSVGAQTLTLQGTSGAECRVPFTYMQNGFSRSETQVYILSRASLGEVWCFDSNGSKSVKPTGGLCPSGTFSPLPEAAFADRLNNAPITADTLRRALDEVLKAGGSINDTGSHSVIGPSSVPGETKTKTTTAPSGATQVSTTSETHNYTYNDNRVTITTTVLTQNPDGSTETQTTDTPDVDQCASNPNSAACVELGQPPSSELPESTKTVSFTPVSFSANQSCPGPVQFNAMGRQLEFSYAPMCDTISTWIRALVLAGCAFIAAFVFIGGLKS